MDADHRDPANRLFATTTALLEDAIEVAMAGQSPRLSQSQILHHDRRLQAAMHDIAVITEAASIIAGLGKITPHDWRSKTR